MTITIDTVTDSPIDKMNREFNQEYKTYEKDLCNCDKRSVIPTIDHRPRCRFNNVMSDHRVVYHDIKTIIDFENETQRELKFLKAEVVEVKTAVAKVEAELTEIKAMLGDFLALFRVSREN